MCAEIKKQITNSGNHTQILPIHHLCVSQRHGTDFTLVQCLYMCFLAQAILFLLVILSSGLFAAKFDHGGKIYSLLQKSTVWTSLHVVFSGINLSSEAEVIPGLSSLGQSSVHDNVLTSKAKPYTAAGVWRKRKEYDHVFKCVLS